MSLKHYCDGENCNKEIEFYKERYYTIRLGIEGKKTPRHFIATEYSFCKKCYFKLNKELGKIGIDLRK